MAGLRALLFKRLIGVWALVAAFISFPFANRAAAQLPPSSIGASVMPSGSAWTDGTNGSDGTYQTTSVPYPPNAHMEPAPILQVAAPQPYDASLGFLPEGAGYAEATRQHHEPLDLPPAVRKRKRSNTPQGSPFTAQAFWIPTQPFRDRQGTLNYSGESYTLGFPLLLSEPSTWIATGYLDHIRLSSSRVLPDSGVPLPDELWAVGAGVIHLRNLDNGWNVGGMLTIGTASDEPFEAARDMTVSSAFFVTIPWGEVDAWKLSLFYSPTAQLNVPLPGFAYIWHPTPAWEIDVGLPFNLTYKPNDRFTWTANYVPVTNFRTMAKFDWNALWSSYASYMVTNETFWLSSRTDDSVRLFLFDQRLTLGVARKIGWGFTLDFSAAYVFDRKLFQSDSFSENRRDELDILSGVAGFIQLSWNR